MLWVPEHSPPFMEKSHNSDGLGIDTDIQNGPKAAQFLGRDGERCL